MTPMYLVAILEDFLLERQDDTSCIKHICLCNRETGKIMFDKLNFVFIELPNFVLTIAEIKTDLERWLYLLKFLPGLTTLPEGFDNPIFEKLLKVAEYTNLDKTDKTMYDQLEKLTRDRENQKAYAIQEVVEKARAEDATKAFEEKLREKRASALVLKNMGLSKQQIADATKLSIEEIEKL